MNNVIQPAIFGGSFIGIFVMGAIHPILGFVALVAFLVFIVPPSWRWATDYNTDKRLKQRRQQIDTAMTQGQVDGELTRQVIEDKRRRGEF